MELKNNQLERIKTKVSKITTPAEAFNYYRKVIRDWSQGNLNGINIIELGDVLHPLTILSRQFHEWAKVNPITDKLKNKKKKRKHK